MSYEHILILSLILFVVLIVVAGKKTVVYYDTVDFFHALTPTVPIVIALIIIATDDSSKKGAISILGWISLAAGVAVSLVLLVFVIKKSIRLNRSVYVGVLVGLLKVLLVPFSAILLIEIASGAISQAFRETSSESKGVDMGANEIYIKIFGLIFKLILGLILGIFVKLLFNGPKIYDARNWEEPENLNLLSWR
ncbi:MAG: hypothetical protein ACOX2F_11775 [bacterium]